MFENVDGRTDGRTTDGRTTDAGVTGILKAHLGAFGSGELKTIMLCKIYNITVSSSPYFCGCFFHFSVSLYKTSENSC